MIHVSAGLITYAKEEFLSRWIGNNATEATKEGIALLLEVTPKFHKLDWEDTDKRLLRFLFQYLFKYKGLLAQLCIGLLWGARCNSSFLSLPKALWMPGPRGTIWGRIFREGTIPRPMGRASTGSGSIGNRPHWGQTTLWSTRRTLRLQLPEKEHAQGTGQLHPL